MKLRNLKITDFRGAAGDLQLKFNDNNYFIYAENGRGKSTIADASEYAVNGDLARFHREGCDLGAAIHIDAELASVVVKLSDGRELTRDLHNHDGSSPLRAGDSAEVKLPSLPILRHATIKDFIEKTGGEKRDALLQILDLDALNGFRATLRKARGHAKDKRDAARMRVDEEQATLSEMLGSEKLIARAQALAKAAGISSRISSEKDLYSLELKLPPGQPDRLSPVNEFVRAAEAWISDDPAEDWNQAVAREGVQREEALITLLRQGDQLLDEGWDENACPLCESPQDKEALGANIKVRAAKLAESRHHLEAVRSDLVQRADSAKRLGTALSALLEVSPDGGWPEHQAIENCVERLKAYEQSLREARLNLTPISVAPDLGIDLAVLPSALRDAATLRDSPELTALTALHDLREQSKRVTKREAERSALESSYSALGNLLDLADATIKAAVEDALKPIQDLAAKFFAMLMVDGIYSDVKLKYVARRSGQVEFSIVYAGRRPALSPPQRIMSESQLNALGIALLLARLKHEEHEWETLILDDVVNGFDAPHRQGLLRLLEDEFSEWQAIVLSHDSAFRDVAMQSSSGGWTFREVAEWTPDGGPVLDDGDPLGRLESELNKGRATSGLGGFARAALEHALSKPLMKLGYKELRYDPRQRFTAHDFLVALRGGLKRSKASSVKVDVLDRMDVANYMSTSLVHRRSGAPEPTRDDLLRLTQDLRDLEGDLICDQCGKPVWHLESNGATHQCECGTLTA